MAIYEFDWNWDPSIVHPNGSKLDGHTVRKCPTCLIRYFNNDENDFYEKHYMCPRCIKQTPMTIAGNRVYRQSLEADFYYHNRLSQRERVSIRELRVVLHKLEKEIECRKRKRDSMDVST